MLYTPKVNDYVTWGTLRGWIYWIDPQESYLTIEIGVRLKPDGIGASHRKFHCLICCFRQDWDKIVYVKSRKSKYDDEVQGNVSET
jgi:hypothetical protein